MGDFVKRISLPVSTINIIGRNDGGSQNSGYIGEIISTTISETVISSSNTALTMSTGLVLGAGIWEINYSLTAAYVTGSTTSDRGQVRMWIYDQAVGIGTIVGNSARSLYTKTTAANAVENITSLSCSIIVNLSASKDYRLGGIRLDGQGTGVATIYATSNFYAKRIA